MRPELENWGEAAKSNWDVTVVGAGLAGIVAADQLAQRGIQVLLLDRKRFPRDKVCGGCLNLQAVQSLRESGFSNCLDSLPGHRLRQLELFSGGNTLPIDLPGGMAISRSRLDHTLLNQAIANGVTFLPGADACVEPYDPNSNYRQLSCRNGDRSQRITTSLVVLATGISAEPMSGDHDFHFEETRGSRIGVHAAIDDSPAYFQPGLIYMAVGREGYVGLTRLEGNSLNLAAAVDRNALRGSTAANVCRQILAENRITLPDSMWESPWKGTCGLTRRRQTSGPRLFVVGDAGSYVEPFTGEGMELAIKSGRAVVDFAELALKNWQPTIQLAWSRQFHRLVARRQWVCRGLSQILRHPHLLRIAFGVTSRFPSVGRTVARMVT